MVGQNILMPGLAYATDCMTMACKRFNFGVAVYVLHVLYPVISAYGG